MTASMAQHRITRLAAERAVHRAFHWLHLHQPQMRLWLLEFVAIPAPPFGESARAEWFADRFRALGLAEVEIDREGNVLGLLSPGPDHLWCFRHTLTLFSPLARTASRDKKMRSSEHQACAITVPD